MAAGWGPIHPTDIDFSDPARPHSRASGGTCLPCAAAQAQAQQVFLAGNGLPQRWAGQPRFVVLEIAFDLGHNFLATWAAWRRCAARPARLVFVSVDKHPPRADELARAHAGHDDALLRELSSALVAHWPPSTPDLHLLDFDGGAVRLLLGLGDAHRVLPELVLQADALYLDSFAPRANPEPWADDLLRGLHRLMAQGATVATRSVADGVCDGLARAGFQVTRQPGIGGEPEMTVGRFAPHHQAPPPPGRAGQPGLRRAAVVGAGLAGAAVARALAGQGLAVQVFERHAGPAQETSGNAGGLFHSVLHPQDGTHARWLRAAALHTERVLRPLVASGQVPGAVDGLLRGEHALSPAGMQALLDTQALPPAHVRVRALALPDGQPAWDFAGGGWVSPADLVAHWLAMPGIALHTGLAVAALRPHGDAWRLADAAGTVIAEADAVVLCNAHDTLRLLGQPAWPLARVRGQTTIVPAAWADWPALLPQPVADGGYALRLADGRVLCGASPRPGDDEPALLAADHDTNLATLRRLTGWTGTPTATAELTDLAGSADLTGRVGWRLAADDRLPLLGPVPEPGAAAQRGRFWGQVRGVARQRGLYVFTALGSRGITQAALGGELLAAWLTGAPWPVPAALADALDVARFDVRAARRTQRDG